MKNKLNHILQHHRLVLPALNRNLDHLLTTFLTGVCAYRQRLRQKYIPDSPAQQLYYQLRTLFLARDNPTQVTCAYTVCPRKFRVTAVMFTDMLAQLVNIQLYLAHILPPSSALLHDITSIANRQHPFSGNINKNLTTCRYNIIAIGQHYAIV
jgi:hypothetical protein